MSDGPARFVAVVALRSTERGWETLLVRRAKEPLLDRWLYVTGGIEAGEAAGASAARELREETGLVADRLCSSSIVESFYSRSMDMVCFVPVFAAFVASDAEAVLNAENSAHSWLDFKSAIAAVPAPNQREVLRRVRDELLAHPIDPWFDLDPATGI